MKNIAIIGGGIIGLTTAYYLSKEKNYKVSLYDDGKQATKAAVGIICPWLNQRRNKYWYELVRDGAEFYDTLISDLDDDIFYHKVGGLYINPKMEEKIFNIAKKRASESYKVGEVKKVNKRDNPELAPHDFIWDTGIFVSGAARVDGDILLETLLKSSLEQGISYHHKKVSIEKLGSQYKVDDALFDLLVLSPGSHLKDLMNFDSKYKVDVRAQKGQLIQFKLDDKNEYPVIMPKGEIDFLFGKDGELVVGASHENQYKDESVDWDVLEQLKRDALEYFPSLENKEIDNHRIGLRAHNSTFTPFYGNLKNDPNIFVASALGSSGLSSGPIIAYRLVEVIKDSENKSNKYFNADDYVYRE